MINLKKNKMTKKDAIAIIKSSKFFSAEFVKKDGSVRYIHGRSGVKKYLKPDAKPQAYKPSDMGYLTIWDMHKKAYRLVNSQTLIKINGKEIANG
jgi:hypothetical protein